MAVLFDRGISDVCLLGDSYISKMSQSFKKNDQKEHGRLTEPQGTVNRQVG